MDGSRDGHAEQSKSERQIPYDVNCKGDLSYDRLTDIEHRPVVIKGRGGGWELVTSGCKLLYIEWVKIQGPTVQHRELCSTFYNKPQWKRI